MKTEDKFTDKAKRNYEKPAIKRVKLDKEISMVMMSTPPDPPESLPSQFMPDNPFKIPGL